MKLAKMLILTLAFCSSLTGYAQNKSLIFATEATYPPFESIAADGKMQGFDIDVINALCRQMQTQCQLVNQPFASLIPSLKMGKYDAIFGALNITKQRQQQIDFTEPYYYPHAAFVTSRKYHDITNADKVKLITIGVQGGTTYAFYAFKNYAHADRIKTYTSIQDALLDLKSGRINAVFGEAPVMQYWLSRNKQAGDFILVPVKSENKAFFGGGVAIGVKKGNKVLLDKLNQALKAIQQNGEMAEIESNYFKTKTQ